MRGALGLPVERDHHFEPEYAPMVYARAAWRAGGITDDPEALARAQAVKDRERAP